jgi:hypothetical protein
MVSQRVTAAMIAIKEIPAWGLKRWDRVRTKDGICTVVRAKKARPYGSGHIEIEMETEDGKRLITERVEATQRFQVIPKRPHRPNRLGS